VTGSAAAALAAAEDGGGPGIDILAGLAQRFLLGKRLRQL